MHLSFGFFELLTSLGSAFTSWFQRCTYPAIRQSKLSSMLLCRLREVLSRCLVRCEIPGRVKFPASDRATVEDRWRIDFRALSRNEASLVFEHLEDA